MLRVIKTVCSSIVICCFLVSCASLKSEHFVGERFPGASAQQEDISLWEFEDNIFYVNVIDSSTLIASTLKWNKEKQEHEIIKREIILTQLKNHGKGDTTTLFLNLKKGDEDLYTILLLSTTSNEKDFLIYTVDKETLKKQIKAKKVKAVQQDDDFILKLTKKELDNYIRENVSDIFIGPPGVLKPLKCTSINNIKTF